ncbi:MAG: acyltransferase family protein [Nocardioides sp.]
MTDKIVGSRSSSGFRGDVQGLRAIAVVAVIVGHAAFGPFDGGFVGVDVFFVVSGFLITQLLLREATGTGQVSMTAFYARRARRILPAASLVLVVTVVASVTLLNLLDAIEVAKDSVWAALFAANVRFALEGSDYFALDQAPSPIQHYWSLAVEEQFYLVWPLLIAACFWLASRHRRRDGHPGPSPLPLAGLLVTITTVGAASFAWSVVQTAAEPEAAYFSSLTRAWELAAGALVALALYAVPRRWPRLLREVLAWSGLVAVLGACVLFDDATAFPGYAAALPVGGTALLLWTGAGGLPTTVARGLAVTPLRVVGDWSYSLYLWHWPMLVLPELTLQRPLTLAEAAFQVVVTFALAYLTFHYVETPFRAHRVTLRPRRALALYPLSLALVLPIALGGWAWADNRVSETGHDPAVTAAAFGVVGDPTEALVEASVLAGEQGWPIPSDLSPDLVDLEAETADVGDCDYEQDVRVLCPRGDPEGDKTLVVTGDSRARAWIPAFEEIAQRAGYTAYYLVKPQCTAALVAPARVADSQPWPECPEFHTWVQEQIAELEPDLVVASSTPPLEGTYDAAGTLDRSHAGIATALSTGFADMFTAYGPLTDRLVLLADIPRLPVDPGVCLATEEARLGDCVFEPDETNTMLRAVTLRAALDAGVEAIDPSAWFCAGDLCPVVVGSTIAYRDRGHVSTTRATQLAQPLGEALGLW